MTTQLSANNKRPATHKHRRCSSLPRNKHTSPDRKQEIEARRRPALHKRRKFIPKVDQSKAKLSGEYSESTALAVLVSLLEAGQIPPASEPAKRVVANSWKDRKGYDIIYLTAFGSLSFQVKSSVIARRKFRKKHPHILCFVVNNETDLERLATAFKYKFWEAHSKLQAAQESSDSTIAAE